MPIKLIAPMQKTFILEEADKRYGVEGEPTMVLIKQATQREHELRQEIFATLERRYSDLSPDEMTLIQTANLETLKRTEVWLTLCDSNLMNENGDKPLFQSRKSKDGQIVLAMTKAQFEEAWGLLPPDVADEIHQKVLEINKMWSASGNE